MFAFRLSETDYRIPNKRTQALAMTESDRFLPLKPTHFHILLSLADAPAHGYGVRHEVEERTEGRIVLAAGTLYETLQRLERDGLVEETPTPADQKERASSRWRFYQATELGRRVLVDEISRLESDLAAARVKIVPVG